MPRVQSIASPRRLCVAAALALAQPHGAAQVASWTGDAGDRTWQSAANWSPAAVPSGLGQRAAILGDFGPSLAITSRAPVTLGELQLSNRSGALTVGAATPNDVFSFDAGPGEASFGVAQGSGAIDFAAPVWLRSRTRLRHDGSAALTFSSVLGGSAALVLDGPGRVGITGDTAAFTGALEVNAGRLDLARGLGTAGGDVRIGAGAVLATAAAVNRAVHGGADATLLMQSPNDDGQGLRGGFRFGDASRTDGFRFAGALRVDNPSNGGVSARFDSAASILIERPQEISRSIYTFANGLTLAGAGQFSGSGVIIGTLTDRTAGGQPFLPTGFGIAFTLAEAHIDAGASDIHYLGHDLRVGSLTMQGGTLRYHRGAGQPQTRFLDLYGPLTGHGVLEADYLTAYLSTPTLVSATGPLTLRGAITRNSSELDVQVSAAGVFRVEGAAEISVARFALAGGRVELPNVVAATVGASSFSGHGTILFGPAGRATLAAVPLAGAATGSVEIAQALEIGGGLGVFHSAAPVRLVSGAQLTLADGVVASASGFTLAGAGGIVGHGLIVGAVDDRSGAAAGLRATGTVGALETLDLPAGEVTLLSLGEGELPFRAAGRSGPTTLHAPNGVALRQAGESIASPQLLSVRGPARIVGSFNAGALEATGPVVLGGGTVRASISTAGTLSGAGVVDGAIVAAGVVPSATLAPLGSVSFSSGAQGLILSDRVATLAPGSLLQLDDTQVAVPNGIDLQGQVLRGSGGIANVRGVPSQIQTANVASRRLSIGFAPGAGAIGVLRLGTTPARLASDGPITIQSLSSDGGNASTRRVVESDRGIDVGVLFAGTPVPLRPELRVRGPLTLRAGLSPQRLETDAATFMGGRMLELVSHGAVGIDGNVTVDRVAVFVHGAAVAEGRTLTVPSVFGRLSVDGRWTAGSGLSIAGRLSGSGRVVGDLAVHGSGRYTNAGLDSPLDMHIADGGIAPGEGGGLGTLSIDGALSWHGGATLELRVGRGSDGALASDRVVFSSDGTSDLGDARLSLLGFGGDAVPGGAIALLVNAGTGSFGGSSFQGLAEGARVAFGAWTATISYTGSFDLASGLAWADGRGNDVVLSQFAPVPEPASALRLAAGLAALLAVVSIRRR